jgi:excisionase family DNA binding protein
MTRPHCYQCRSAVRSMAEHLTTDRHRRATTSIRSSGPAGAHPYRPPVHVGSEEAYWAERERLALEDRQPPSIDVLAPLTDDAAMMTLREAAQSLGICHGTLRRQVWLGRLTGQRIGRDWLVSEAEVARYRAESRGRPGRPRGVRRADR